MNLGLDSRGRLPQHPNLAIATWKGIELGASNVAETVREAFSPTEKVVNGNTVTAPLSSRLLRTAQIPQIFRASFRSQVVSITNRSAYHELNDRLAAFRGDHLDGPK